MAGKTLDHLGVLLVPVHEADGVVAHHVEVHAPLEPGPLLPRGEGGPSSAGGEPLPAAADEERRVRAEGLAGANAQLEQPRDLPPHGVAEEHELIIDVLVAPLEYPQRDAALDGSTRSAHVTDVQAEELVLPERGVLGQAVEHVVAEAGHVLAGDTQQAAPLAVGEGLGGAGERRGVVGHDDHMGSGAADRQVPEQRSQGPAIISHFSEQDLADVVRDERGFLETFVSSEGAPLQLEQFQAAFLDTSARMRWVTKARQVGFSFIIALEALARCHLRSDYTAHIVSFSQAEAKEKLLIARQAYESLPLGFRKKLVTDSKTELGFESPGGGGVSRIIVHPSKAPRGRKGDIYLDELAHYVTDREVYTGSTPLILRSGGQLTGCSTPLGRRGIFWEIAEQELRKYPHHARQVVPWWRASFFCNSLAAAAREAPFLPTAEAVARFGTQQLIEQFAGLTIEDFEQEYSCIFIDSSFSFLPYELILPCTADLVLAVEPADIPRPEGRLVAGYDVGRTRDRSVLSVFEERESTFTCRMLKTFSNTRFDEQEGELRRLLNTAAIARLSIDQTGIGMQLAENLSREFPQVVGEYFTNEAKERWATNAKILLQRKHLFLPRDRRLVADFHSIRRKVLPSGKVAFDGDRTAGGHADGFWSVALAVQRELAPEIPRGAIVTVRIIGGDGPDARSEQPNRMRREPTLHGDQRDDVAPRGTTATSGTIRADRSPEPGSYEWNRRMFVDVVYDDDNPPPSTIRPRRVDEAPFLLGRGEKMPPSAK